MAKQVITTEVDLDELRLIIQESVEKAIGVNLNSNSTNESEIGKFLSRKEMANELHISLPTLNSWRKKGLPYIKVEGTAKQKILFERAAVHTFLMNKQISLKK